MSSDLTPIELEAHRKEVTASHKKRLNEVIESSKIPYYVSDDADLEQVYALLEMARTGKYFMMLNVPDWMQKHYLVMKSTLIVQLARKQDKFAFHRHWPECNYIYNEEPVSLEKATNLRYNKKGDWEFEEYLGCEYCLYQYTGSHIADIPAFTIYGVRLPGGGKYIHPSSWYANQ